MELVEEIKKRRKRRDFNLNAMKQLIDENGFLKSKYDKLSVNAEERFGYHWNEVICNVLYNKYVKSDKKLLERYKALKTRHDIEKERTDYKDARPNIKPDQQEEIVQEKTKKDIYMKKDKINEMSASGGNSVGSGAPTGNASGAYEVPAAWSASNKSRRFFKDTLVKGSKIVKDGMPDNTLMKESSIGDLLEDFTQMMRELEHDVQPTQTSPQTTSQPNVLEYHIVTNNEGEFYADVRNAEGKTIFEINSLDEINTLISDGALQSKEDVDGLSKILKSQHLMNDGDVLELAELNEEANSAMPIIKRELNPINEEVKSNGMVQVDRINAINRENSLNYYKTLNDGIQDLIKIEKPVGVAIEATIKYDYDNNDGAKVENGVFPEEGKYNDEFRDTAHRGMEDWKLDRPDTKYDERLKKMVGTKAYNILKDKQRVIMNKDLKNTPAGRFKSVENAVTESFLSGYYLDFYGNKKIKTTNISKITEVDTLNEGVIHFETKGVGNVYNEILKEQIETYNFYYNLNENTFIKIIKTKDANKQKNMLNESAVKKVKYMISYDPSKNVKNIIDRSKL